MPRIRRLEKRTAFRMRLEARRSWRRKVKQEIADEVKNELALENSEAQQTAQHQDVDPASSGIARLLTDGHPHVFVVGSALDVVDVNGQECGISDGDALALKTPPEEDATAADMVVLASKGGQECAKNDVVTVQLTDLQEMQNQMRATIDQGLQELQSKQGKDGLPPAPPSGTGSSGPGGLCSHRSASRRPGRGCLAAAGSAGRQPRRKCCRSPQDEQCAGGAPVAALCAGSASDRELGQKLRPSGGAIGCATARGTLGPKVIYYYNGMKVIFMDGKVSDVQ